ncbi:MAG: PEP-CTERM sorting domain-containing protein, partial [Pseudomonadales bacterium]
MFTKLAQGAMRKTFKQLAPMAAIVFATQANAGLMLDTGNPYASNTPTPGEIGGYTMTDFALTNLGDLGALTTSVTLPSPLSGEIQFKGKATDPNAAAPDLDMMRETADTTGWWVNGEDHNYDIFTTNVNWVELVLPENTRAFSFNVGASFNGWGWMVGFNDGASKHDIYSSFNVSSTNTPGFGVYADNSDGSCGSISSVIIDPSDWGVGNFSINVGECTASVPEPGVLSLLAVGLFGLGLA